MHVSLPGRGDMTDSYNIIPAKTTQGIEPNKYKSEMQCSISTTQTAPCACVRACMMRVHLFVCLFMRVCGARGVVKDRENTSSIIVYNKAF